MSQFFSIHPQNPQVRLIKQAVKIIQEEGVIVYPTDSAYALGTCLENKSGLEKIRQIRNLDAKHNFTLVCHNLSELGTYALVDNSAFRLLKAHTPGPYTFILTASKEVPKRLMHPKRNTIGLRIPDNKIVQALLTELQAPLMSVTLLLPNQAHPVVEANELYELLQHEVDLVIDGGPCPMNPTTVVDLVNGRPKIIREGQGDTRFFT